MHPLHTYVAKQLADKLKDRRVVIWYDERREFQPFVDELRGGPWRTIEPVLVAAGSTKARLAEYAGSLFELRAAVEPLTAEISRSSWSFTFPALPTTPRAPC